MPLTPPKVKHWWEHNYPFMAIGLGLVVGIELATRSPLSGQGALRTELGRWSGLLGTYGALLVIVLVACNRGLDLAMWKSCQAARALIRAFAPKRTS